MTKTKPSKSLLSQQVLEVRHQASGSFLDVRGKIADHIKQGSKAFPHWSIEKHNVSFRDSAEAIKTEGAFVGYKSTGYIVFDPPTRNYLEDRATAFWKLLRSMTIYSIPELTRFGVRTKVFIPIERTFEQINDILYKEVFTDKLRKLLDSREKDLSFTIQLTDSRFNVRLLAGPVDKEEAASYFSFESDHFKKCGLFLDIDYFTSDKLTLDGIPDFLKQATELTWIRAERIARGFSF